MQVVLMPSTLNDKMCYPVGEKMDDNKPYINEMIKTFNSIEAFKDKNITFICRGSSGAIIAGIFCMNIPNSKILHIKKEGERSHDDSAYLGRSTENIRVIVDDFMCSGETLNAIYDRLGKANRSLDEVRIDCLVLSGEVDLEKLSFRPEYLVCGKVKK